MFGICLLKKAVVFPQEMFPKRKMISFVENTLVEPGWRLSNVPIKRKAIPPSKMFSKCSPERRVMPPVETSQAPVST